MRTVKKGARGIIRIPSRLRKYALAKLHVSSRLANLWRKKGFKVLGDIHGMAFEDYLAFDYFGERSLAELRSLVAALKSGREPFRTTSALDPRVGQFSVLPNVARLKLTELPVSVRLGHVLQRKGIKKLGDLNGLEVRQLFQVRNCGVTTIAELNALLARAASGEFQAQSSRFSPADARAIIKWLDRVLDTIEPRDRKIFISRFAAKQWGKPTLEEAGAKYGLTRERVRQIETEVVTAARRQGGPWAASRLEALARHCRQGRPVITPELLADWLKGITPPPAHPLVVYVRILGRLDPNLPVYPRAETALEKQRRLAGKPPPGDPFYS